MIYLLETKVFATQIRVTISRLYLNPSILNGKDGKIEGLAPKSKMSTLRCESDLLSKPYAMVAAVGVLTICSAIELADSFRLSPSAADCH